MTPHNALLLFHCASNTGYAIATLERTFEHAARRALPDASSVHYAYSSLETGPPAHVTDPDSRFISIDYHAEPDSYRPFVQWIREQTITHVLAFDLPVRSSIAKALREAGVERIVSYWGASISDVFPWYMRPLRRTQFLVTRSRPDHFVFESEGMRDRALFGSCIPREQTSVCHIGVDTQTFSPSPGSRYAHEVLGIPPHRRLVYFSGHMEERKGVHVLIDAFLRLHSGTSDLVHLVLAGNTVADEQRLRARFAGTPAEQYITFAGYRKDVHLLQQSATLGVIASTGWDSFTVSAVEMMATGLPLLVSDLPGLREAVIPSVTGERFPTGDVNDLASRMLRIVSDDTLLCRYGLAARERAVSEFSLDRQINTLAQVIRG